MIKLIDPLHEAEIRRILATLPDTDPDKPSDEWFQSATETLRDVEAHTAHKIDRRGRR